MVIEKNIDIYVKTGVEVPFEEYIEVEDIDEAIAQINFNTSGYSSSIFTDNNQNAMIYGDLNYSSKSEISVPENVVKGDVNYSQLNIKKPTIGGIIAAYVLEAIKFI